MAVALWKHRPLLKWGLLKQNPQAYGNSRPHRITINPHTLIKYERDPEAISTGFFLSL